MLSPGATQKGHRSTTSLYHPMCRGILDSQGLPGTIDATTFLGT